MHGDIIIIQILNTDGYHMHACRQTSKLPKRNRDSQAKMVVVYVILMSQSMQCHVSRSYHGTCVDNSAE